jgi:DNA-binding NarL/FixJ family response regulator
MMQGRQSHRLGVLVVDDEGFFRETLSIALARHPRIKVLGAAPDGETALRMRDELDPDVVVLDAELEGELDSLATARAIAARRNDTGLVLLASRSDRAYVGALSAMKLAGWAYVERSALSDIASLVQAMEGAAAGLAVLDPASLDGAQTRRNSTLQLLTPRQQEVLSLMAQGFSNGAIAETLVLEGKSVENHINAIFNQLGAGRDSTCHPRVRAVLTYLQESSNGVPSADTPA